MLNFLKFLGLLNFLKFLGYSLGVLSLHKSCSVCSPVFLKGSKGATSQTVDIYPRGHPVFVSFLMGSLRQHLHVRRIHQLFFAAVVLFGGSSLSHMRDSASHH